MTLLSQRGYARHRRCSLYAVQKAIRSGRIAEAVAGGKIDPARADALWIDNTHPAYIRTADVPIETADEPSRSGFRRARAAREIYLARLTKLSFDLRSGALISGEAVRLRVFNTARSARDMILAVPDRVAPLIPAADEAEINRILRDEMLRVCAVLKGLDFMSKP